QEQVQQLFPESTFYRFDPKYFSGQKAFAQLTLREEFYEQFGWAEYMLLLLGNTIFVKNELHYWCKQGHDYVSDKNGWCSLRKIKITEERFINSYLVALPLIMITYTGTRNRNAYGQP